ncbi:cysteine-rich with EGF-like domain protein 2 [Centruroides sculpturatus]|uniref:cysteine-rich with EGF-like domain protein 2 n=1 Tax=Centruroides sculpturatus TaxID=218467 RepID=UPI000C6EAEAD|nr:cysteine-rich with EGF-like domain protein 2 [Centruroides sculpturatus]
MDIYYMSRFFLYILLLIKNMNLNDAAVNNKDESLAPCQICKILTKSFEKGIESTVRGKFEGGDASWEESRLGSYANSEVRLVEIQEKLCKDTDQQIQCLALADEQEAVLEEWWFHKRNSTPDLYQYLCIDKLKVCCPDNHYGPECKACPGDIAKPCSGHGQCKGSGTRNGSGQCKCDEGYTGEVCDRCLIGYYEETADDDNVCLKCDRSCKGHCREGGSKGCEVCADGYRYIIEDGCMDIDECLESDKDPCTGNTFCVNTYGTYRCLACDKSCEGCTGDGPDVCIKCANKYTLEDGLCIEKSVVERNFHIEIARYATYGGLCIATCIIFRRSSIIAGLIGVFVAVYIALSEYTLGDWDRRSFAKLLKSWLSL